MVTYSLTLTCSTIDRLQRALEYVEDQNISISALVVVGGVAANKNLRTRLLKMVEKKNNNDRGLGIF